MLINSAVQRNGTSTKQRNISSTLTVLSSSSSEQSPVSSTRTSPTITPPVFNNNVSTVAAAAASSVTANHGSCNLVIPNPPLPRVAHVFWSRSPVHIDIGGVSYTTSFQTLTKYPESKLAKLFNGNIPIVLDVKKDRYFIDRDGNSFRHILNFLRTDKLVVPDNFDELELMYREALFYEIAPLVLLIEVERAKRELIATQAAINGLKCGVKRPRAAIAAASAVSALKTSSLTVSNCIPVDVQDDDDSSADDKSKIFAELALKKRITAQQKYDQSSHHHHHHHHNNNNNNNNHKAIAMDEVDLVTPTECYQCLSVNITPELGERVSVSGERAVIAEIFPEISLPILDTSKNATWNRNEIHVVKFPLNGFSNLTSLQTLTRLLDHNFKIIASNGGGLGGQQFSEYILARRIKE